MSLKSKGSNAERQLLHMFWDAGWACLRSAGSGSMNHPGPDLLAGSKENNRRVAVECKTSKSDRIYLSDYDINQLKEFSEKFGAIPLIAIRFDRVGWFFVHMDDLGFSKTNHYISLYLAQKKGLKFEEIIGEYKQLKF